MLEPMILGIDFFHSREVILNSGEKTITFKIDKGLYTFQYAKKHSPHDDEDLFQTPDPLEMLSSAKLTIPSHNRRYVPIAFKNENAITATMRKNGEWGTINDPRVKGILVPCGLTQIPKADKNNTIPQSWIYMDNLTDHSITINKAIQWHFSNISKWAPSKLQQKTHQPQPAPIHTAI